MENTQTEFQYKYDYDWDVLLKSKDGHKWFYYFNKKDEKPIYSDYEKQILEEERELYKEAQEAWIQLEIEKQEDPLYWENYFHQYEDFMTDEELKIVSDLARPTSSKLERESDINYINDDNQVENIKFPIEVLPNVVKKYIVASAEITQQDVEIFALPSLIGLATAIGTSRKVATNKDYKTLPILYGVLIANPGAGKSPAISKALEPLEELQKEAFEQYYKDKKQYEIDLENYQKGRKKAKDEDFNEEAPVPPKLKEYLANDATIEAITKLMENNQKGIVSIQDEFEGFYNSLNGYRAGIGADLQKWLTIWNGGMLKVDRQQQEPKFIKETFCCLIGAMTPSGIARIAANGNTDNGFLDRILFCWIDSNRSFKITKESMPEQIKNNYFQLFKELTELKFKKDRDIPLNDGAFEKYDSYNDRLAEIAGEDEKLQSIHSKIMMYLVRFALIIHLCEQQKEFVKHEEIQAESMDKAIQLCEYFRGQQYKIYDKLTTSESEILFDKALKAIKKKSYKEGKDFLVKRRDIYKNMKIKVEKFNEIEPILIEHEILSVKDKNSRGTLVYFVNQDKLK
ncbi:DUF3987 domain-containing protein [Schinkia azotoformans]|uniref:DUF3987 domain-containing protein n=1 Tax=Schinkia azotoformans LMG 9581 TaxID=1131731 RepID=K6DIE6_SCHAZ|nr:DUF3987 domain-containing protein [Schinkia azotoformans]EKN68054.1 hypothetical protein BAZO_06039 [Schinkia azotoformans LMG 9581]MEC1638140.1 DUF3987 domain-containing protein [Schinkia azotoformans]MEC1946426.1 DUF3987 domain-containing protein [Schinkia azotoformans]